jgi:SPP1 gp7 family putative phage head morphogenesis protein
LRDWLKEVFPHGSEAEIADWERRLMSGEAKFRDVLRRALQNGTDLGVTVAFDQFETLGMAFDYTLANTHARQWAADYVGQLISNITDTTRASVRQAVAAWTETGAPLSQLTRDLQPTFGRRRAQLIASTEATRAYAEGEEVAYIESGVVDEYEIMTAEDERVCPICGSHRGKRYALRSGTKPPFHPGCRCWISPVVR